MVWGNQTSGVRPDDKPEATTSGHFVAAEFSILLVCTGNICRSPLAEQLLTSTLRRSLADGFGAARADALMDQVAITSAGTSAREGSPMTPEALAQSERLGSGGRSHLAHRLTADDVRAAGLILALSSEHRKAVATLDPFAARRAFTLVEFARLLAAPNMLDCLVAHADDEYAATLGALVSVIAASRGYVSPPARSTDLDVTDPYGRSARVYAQVASVIGDATTAIAAAFVNVLRDT